MKNDTMGNTARDFYIKLALDKEILRAKGAEAEIFGRLISGVEISQEGRLVTLSLTTESGESLSGEFSTVTKILTGVSFDYEGKKFVFTFDDGSTLECSIAEFIDLVEGRITSIGNQVIELSRQLDDEEERAVSEEQRIESKSEGLVEAEESRAKAAEEALSDELTAHTLDTNNPHSVTKAQVGLSEVDNKSEATIKSDFTGSIASGNEGFVLGKDVYGHTSNTSNPHEVTKAQVGLGNVDNTSDLNKPISTAQQAALDNKTNIPAAPTDGKYYILTSGRGELSWVEVSNIITIE